MGTNWSKPAAFRSGERIEMITPRLNSRPMCVNSSSTRTKTRLRMDARRWCPVNGERGGQGCWAPMQVPGKRGFRQQGESKEKEEKETSGMVVVEIRMHLDPLDENLK